MASLEEEAQHLRRECQEALDLARRAVQELNRHLSMQQEDLALSCKRRSENALARAVQCYKQLESAARALPPNLRRRYKAEVKNLQSEVTATRKNLAAAVEQGDRARLFAGAGGLNGRNGGNPFSSSAIRDNGRSAVRDRIDETTQRLHETTRMLERTQQTVAETVRLCLVILLLLLLFPPIPIFTPTLALYRGSTLACHAGGDRHRGAIRSGRPETDALGNSRARDRRP